MKLIKVNYFGFNALQAGLVLTPFSSFFTARTPSRRASTRRWPAAYNLWAPSRRRQPPVCLLLFRVAPQFFVCARACACVFVFAARVCKNSFTWVEALIKQDFFSSHPFYFILFLYLFVYFPPRCARFFGSDCSNPAALKRSHLLRLITSVLPSKCTCKEKLILKS